MFLKAHVVGAGVPGRVYCTALFAWSSWVLYVQAHVMSFDLLGCGVLLQAKRARGKECVSGLNHGDHSVQMSTLEN